MSHIIRSYRRILKHVTGLPSGQALKDHVRLQFKAGSTLVDKNEINLRVETVKCYVKLISSVNELQYLRSLDTGEKLTPREVVRATAAKVGLSVPQFFGENGK